MHGLAIAIYTLLIWDIKLHVSSPMHVHSIILTTWSPSMLRTREYPSCLWPQTSASSSPSYHVDRMIALPTLSSELLFFSCDIMQPQLYSAVVYVVYISNLTRQDIIVSWSAQSHKLLLHVYKCGKTLWDFFFSFQGMNDDTFLAFRIRHNIIVRNNI